MGYHLPHQEVSIAFSFLFLFFCHITFRHVISRRIGYLFFIILLAEPKEQLTETEQQLKRAEAAQRRKIQNEKAARESEVCLIFHAQQLFSDVWILV